MDRLQQTGWKQLYILLEQLLYNAIFCKNQEEPNYRYYCAPPDQDSMNDLVNAVSSLNLTTTVGTPPVSRTRFQNHTPRARASMGFDVHRGTASPESEIHLLEVE